MKIQCEITIECKKKSDAEKILKSVKIDDQQYVKSQIKDNTLIAQIESNTVPSLLHTLDDYLACVSIAEKIVDKS